MKEARGSTSPGPRPLRRGGLPPRGHPALERALANAVTRETRWGLSIMKEAKNSTRKIDPAVAAVLARLARGIALVDVGPSVYEERGLLFV